MPTALLRRALRPLGLAAAALASGCAVTLDADDVFVLRHPHVAVAELPRGTGLDAGLDAARITELRLEAAGRSFLGYRVAVPAPQRALIVFPGNGNGAPAVLPRLVAALDDGQTDLYVVSYGQPGEPPPAVAQLFAMAPVLAARAARDSGLPPARVAAMGHSLGGWLALQLGGSDAVGCVMVTGPGTTPADTAARLAPAPVGWVAAFRPTPDIAQFDGVALAQRSRVPTLVIGSEADDVMPPTRTRAVFAALAPRPANELLVVPDARHGGYLRDPAVLAAMQRFLRQRCGG